jgi:thiamine kinase-like enzyme
LKLRSPEKFDELVAPLYEIIFPADNKCALGMFYESSAKFALLSLESIEKRTPEVERAIGFVRGYCDNLKDVLMELLAPSNDSGRYWVITHGDTWNNNIMFLHDAQGKVVRVKLVDFQVSCIASPVNR